MKRMRLFFCVATALALTGCGLGGIASAPVPPAPAVLAAQTVLDEQGILAIELAYKAARLAVETGVDAGRITGPTALRFAVLDNQAFLAVTLGRSAYRAGNAASYRAAMDHGRAAVTALLSLTH